MKFIRISLRTILYALGAAALLLLAAELALRYLLPADGVQKKVISFISRQTNGDIGVKNISAGLSGIHLDKVSVKAPDGEEILYAESVLVKILPFELFKGDIDFNDISIDGLKANIVRGEDGAFNFEPLFSPSGQGADNSAKGADESFLKDLTVKRLQIKNSEVYYTDSPSDIKLSLKDIFLDVYDFKAAGPFRLSLNAWFNYEDKNFKAINIPLAFTVKPDLKGFNWEAALADIEQLVIERGDSILKIKASINGFVNPNIQLNARAGNFSSEALSGLLDTSAFYLGDAALALSGSYNSERKKITLNSLNLSALNSVINAKGGINFGGSLSYNIDTQTALALGGFSKAFSVLGGYSLDGFISGSVKFNNGNIRGRVSAQNAGFVYPEAGVFSNINAIADINSLKEITVNALTGRLNGNKFKIAFSYLDKGADADVNFNLQADQIKLTSPSDKGVSASYDPEREPVLDEEEDSSGEDNKGWLLPPLNIKGEASAAVLDTPYFNASGFDFKADVRDFTPGLSGVNGHLSLNTQSGVIKDLHKLTNENALTKVLFVSLGVVSKLINSLDVLALLNTLSAAVLPSDKQEQALDGAQEKISGALNYESLAMDLDFKNGISDIKNGSFVSPLISFDLAGDINFNSRAINMTVNAAPGKIKSGGIMPLRIKVGGTIENPSGKMSMIASAVSLVSQTIFKNPGSKLVKKSLNGVLGVFGLSLPGKKEKGAGASGGEDFIALDTPPSSASDAAN